MHDAQAAKLFPTAEEQRQFAQSPRSAGAGQSGGGTFDIQVSGVLTKEPDLFAALFGGGNTAYTDIQRQLAVAQSDPGVSDVRMLVDSPGGHVDGLFDTIAAIESFSKPISVLAGDAQSAAYALAAAAGPIQATNAAATFGSIGVVQSLMVDESIVTLTNTESPDKRPDPSTEEGREVIVRNLDAVHGLLVEAISAHRNTTASAVNKDFGRGATLLAGEAKERGMIDSVARPVLRAVGQTNATASRGAEGKVMNAEELKAQHPALYAAVVDEGLEQGVAQERERCIGHLLIGEKANALPIALKAIREGTGMTFGIQAEYMAAMATRTDTAARERDEQDAEAALGGVAQKPKASDLGSQVADRVEALLGTSRAQGGHVNG